MKKVTLTMMVMVLIGCIIMIIANAETANVVDVCDDRNVHHKSASEVYNWVYEWIQAVGDKRNADQKLVDGYYRGYGVIDGIEFEKEYGCAPNAENMEAILRTQYDLSEFSIVVSGYYEDYAVYKMIAKSDTQAIGGSYNYETGKSVDYYAGDMYFMIAYDD